ncbi:MAG TPA: hypothetical protein VNJ29_03935, partial [Candidatus Nitrosotenuis sp.]|nr:hypothetical protein [Candidatus Nitrosotenuis sp.]
MTRAIYTPSLKAFTYSLGITCLIPAFDQFPFNLVSLTKSCTASTHHDSKVSRKLAQQIFALLDAH